MSARAVITEIRKSSEDPTSPTLVKIEIISDPSASVLIPRRNVIGDHWCVGWHGTLVEEREKEFKFYADR